MTRALLLSLVFHGVIIVAMISCFAGRPLRHQEMVTVFLTQDEPGAGASGRAGKSGGAASLRESQGANRHLTEKKKFRHLPPFFALASSHAGSCKGKREAENNRTGGDECRAGHHAPAGPIPTPSPLVSGPGDVGGTGSGGGGDSIGASTGRGAEAGRSEGGQDRASGQARGAEPGQDRLLI